jgi:hypothetical protein
MRGRDGRVTFLPGAFKVALLLVLAVAAGSSPQAQEQAVEFLPREDMIEAIIRYAASGGCDTRRKVFGAAFDARCRKPNPGDDEAMAMWVTLDRLRDRDLVDLCRRNKIADCERPREVSTGRPILTFESAFEVEFNSYRAAWSPDGRLLLLDNLNLPAGEVRLLDVAAGRLLDPPLYSGPIHDAAWSPDGTYIALSDRKRASPDQPPPVGTARLYSTGTRHEVAHVTVADAGCSLGFLEGMAFTADARALWVLCSQADKTAKAVKLRVPELALEDSFLPASPVAALSEGYWEQGIVRFLDDLIATARFHSPKPVSGLRSVVQSYSLRTKLPLHAPIPAAAAARLAPDLSGLYVGNELWSTRSGERIATGVDPSGRTLGAPNRIPQLAMHIEAKPLPKSQHGALTVLDSATGATVQELGPMPRPLAILVSPNGARVAVPSFQGIRFYRVNPDATAAPAAHGR